MAPSESLNMRFDVGMLCADLNVLRGQRWDAQRSYGQEGTSEESTADWRILPLRSLGGDPHRTDPGGAGLEDFADTPWLAMAPYLAKTIAAIPAPVRSVRLMALGSGAKVDEHRDSKFGFQYGTLRLHVPIETNPGAVVVIDGVPRHWTAGQLWFGDFSRPHYVANSGNRPRIHMVIDCLITRELLNLFPAAFLDRLRWSDVILARDPVPLTPAEIGAFRCRFRVPGDFPQWSEDETVPAPDAEGGVEVEDGRLVLHVNGQPTFGLVHLSLGEFRFTGWTEERTVLLDPESTARFRVRYGRRLQEQSRPVRV